MNCDSSCGSLKGASELSLAAVTRPTLLRHGYHQSIAAFGQAKCGPMAGP